MDAAKADIGELRKAVKKEMGASTGVISGLAVWVALLTLGLVVIAAVSFKAWKIAYCRPSRKGDDDVSSYADSTTTAAAVVGVNGDDTDSVLSLSNYDQFAQQSRNQTFA